MQVTNIKTPQTQDDDFIEIQSDTGTAFQRWTVRKMTMLQQVGDVALHYKKRTDRNSLYIRAPDLTYTRKDEDLMTSVMFCLFSLKVMANVMSLSAPELRLQGLLLVIVWFCLAFRLKNIHVDTFR